jgi:hypothetical protein
MELITDIRSKLSFPIFSSPFLLLDCFCHPTFNILPFLLRVFPESESVLIAELISVEMMLPSFFPTVILHAFDSLDGGLQIRPISSRMNTIRRTNPIPPLG